MSKSIWGIDLGGTKIEGVVLESRESLETLCRIRVPTEKEKGYDHILDQIALLVEKMKTETGHSPEKIGLGTPGAINRKGLLKNSNTTCLNDRPLLQDLEKKLGISLAIQNDANCFALTEAIFGAAKGSNLVFGVIMGTGVGGGIVIDQKVIQGFQSIAGEWGHNELVPDGPDCYCGKKGCVETIISGPALERYHKQRTGQSMKLAAIADAAEQGNSEAIQTLDYLCEHFGKAISCIVNILDPDCIVLGGGVSNIDQLYTKGIECARKYVFNDDIETKIVRNELGDSAGVFGAALLVRDQ